MSQENVDVVRRSVEAYARGDLAAALADAHPEIAWNPFEEMPMRGLDSVRAYLARWESDWEELKTTPEEFIDAGERVLATVRFNGRGSASGVDVEARSYTVYTMRDGKIIAMEEFIARTDALVAAGLRE